MVKTTVLNISRLSSIAILIFVILALAATTYAEDSTATATTRRGAAQEKIDTRKLLVQGKIDDLKARIASKEAELKTRLDAFKDQRKAQIAARVNTNLGKINEVITKAMKNHLNKMSEILNKLSDRVNSGKPDIKNPDLAKLAIASASASIASASAAVDKQANNDYTIEATSEATIRTDAQTMRQKLFNDLMNVRKLVIDAKQAVGNAIRVAKSGQLVPEKEATNSGE